MTDLNIGLILVSYPTGKSEINDMIPSCEPALKNYYYVSLRNTKKVMESENHTIINKVMIDESCLL